MNGVMADLSPLKFDIDDELRQKMQAVFGAQGVTIREGMSRLISFLVESPPEMHPIILRQVRGRAAQEVARTILEVGHIPKEVRKAPSSRTR